MKASDIFEGEVVSLFPNPKKDPKYDVTYDDLYRNFIHVWNTTDEWEDTTQALFAVADELYVRGNQPPADWNYRPGLAARVRGSKKMSDKEKYNKALRQQQGIDTYTDLENADTETLEKFGALLIRLRDKLKDENRDH